MRSSFLSVTVVGALLSATPASASLIDHGSSTTDTATGLDYLDLNATHGQTYNAVIGGYGGYIAGDWRYASSGEVTTLFNHAGGPGTYSPQSVAKDAYGPPSVLLASLRGYTHLDTEPNTGFGIVL